MDSQSKRKEVTALIDSIKEHSDRLKDSNTMPMLEMSVILSKINRLQEATLILKYLLAQEQHKEDREFGHSSFGLKSLVNAVAQKKEQAQESESLVADKSELEEGEEIMVEMEVEMEDDEADLSELEEGEEIMVEMEVEMEDDEADLSDIETKEPEGLKEPEVAEMPIDEIIQHLEKEELNSKPDLNEQYADEEDKSLGDQLQKQPIADLVSAIGLNERYLYANELFEGDVEAFKSLLVQINEMSNHQEAIVFFEEIVVAKKDWEKDHEMVKALRVLVKRRFL